MCPPVSRADLDEALAHGGGNSPKFVARKAAKVGRRLDALENGHGDLKN
jgi:hypothetical protein